MVNLVTILLEDTVAMILSMAVRVQTKLMVMMVGILSMVAVAMTLFKVKPITIQSMVALVMIAFMVSAEMICF